MEMCSPI